MYAVCGGDKVNYVANYEVIIFHVDVFSFEADHFLFFDSAFEGALRVVEGDCRLPVDGSFVGALLGVFLLGEILLFLNLLLLGLSEKCLLLLLVLIHIA